MFILGNLLLAIAQVLSIFLNFLVWLIVIRALISWVNPDPFNPIVQFLIRTTEPFLEPIRRFLPQMAIDISPIVAFLLIQFTQTLVVQTLFDLAYRLKM